MWRTCPYGHLVKCPIQATLQTWNEKGIALIFDGIYDWTPGPSARICVALGAKFKFFPSNLEKEKEPGSTPMVALIQSFLVDPQKHIVSVLRSTASAVHQHFADTESIHAIHSVSWKVGVILFHRKRWPCIETNSRDCRTLRTRLHGFTIRGLKAKPHRGMQLVSEQSPIGRMNIQYTSIYTFFFECALIVLIAPIYSDSFQSEVHMLATGHTRHSSTDIFPQSNLANVDPWYQAN